jgi:hypothetical protein
MERFIEMTAEEKAMAVNLGALGYPPAICRKVMDDGICDHPDFQNHYERGEARGEYVIDLKLLELSQQGDLKALAKLEQRKRTNKR